MGVPALFRWLSQKYPKIVSPVIETQPIEVDGVKIPVDTTKPNPNGEEFDNLYLDMNGIVHPCSHPEDRPAPETEEAMMLAIFEYTDRVVNMVRPRKLLMIAVDGVAPRAKMNQQRSRRFRSAQEAREKDEEKKEFLKMLKSQNGGILKEGTAEMMEKKTWDSNTITPGTPFMNTLAACLRYWCAYKGNTDPGWAKMKIIISDASVPGEGEHKIMQFIRSQRTSPKHDPNTRHVIYGLDADLIMLGLATHEPHFRVLREDVFFQESKGRTCNLCGQTGHFAAECKGEVKVKEGEFDEKSKAPALKPFIWLHVSILREYLEVELDIPDQPFRFDLERALDDWVFMCFFVGNDFLPHLPSLDIRENGIDTLIAIWRENIPIMGSYLTKDGQVDLERAQVILDGLAKQEDVIFKRRRQTEERKEANNKRRKVEEENRKNGRQSNGTGNGRPSHTKGAEQNPPPDMPLFAPGKGPTPKEMRAITYDMVINRGAAYQADMANKSAAAALKSKMLNRGNPVDAEKTDSSVTDGNTPANGQPSAALGKRKADLIDDDSSTPGRNTPIESATPKDVEPSPDTVMLWEEGYADRYYEQKFKADPKDIAFRNNVAQAYVEGLAWVLLYYFQGCPSWTWFYPYHYAPFAADFVDLHKTQIKFDQGKPFRPYEQLMGVLPAASNHAIPEVFRSLMSEEDSEILDFYPEDFPIDLNGKKFTWQGVALLPFIDSDRLLQAMATRYPLLSAEDAARNETGQDVLIFSDSHALYTHAASHFYSKKQAQAKFQLDPQISGGLSGELERNDDYVPQSSLLWPLEEGSMPNLEEDRSISLHYVMPESKHIHKSMLLRGVKPPPPILTPADKEATRNRSKYGKGYHGGGPPRDSRYNGRGRGRSDFASNGRSNDRPNDRSNDRFTPFGGQSNAGPPPLHAGPPGTSGYGVPSWPIPHGVPNYQPPASNGWGRGLPPPGIHYDQPPPPGNYPPVHYPGNHPVGNFPQPGYYPPGGQYPPQSGQYSQRRNDQYPPGTGQGFQNRY